MDEEDSLSKNNSIKTELDAIYDNIREDNRTRSKYDWYEHSKKSRNLFLNLKSNKELKTL